MNQNDYTARGSDDPATIEREIEGTRSRMTRDLDAIGRKLSPRNLAAEAGNAITDRARDTGHGLLSMVRDNPWPAAAVGASVAWLVVQARSGQHSTSRWQGVRTYEGPGRRFGDMQDAGDYDEEPSRIDTAKEKASQVASSVADKAHELGDSASHAVDVAKAKAADLTTTAKARASDLAATAKDRTRRLGMTIQDESRQVRETLQQQTHEHPLMVAAGAAVLGLVLGMVIPATSKENEVLGPARDRLADRVEETASRVKDVATDEARRVADSVKDEVQQHTPELKNAARDVAENVKEDLKQSAGRVKDEARAAATSPQPGISRS